MSAFKNPVKNRFIHKTIFLCLIYSLVIIFLFPVSAEVFSSERIESQLLAIMTPEERVGQLFMPAISAQGLNGTEQMDDTLQSLISRYHPGGVILFSRDISTAPKLTALTQGLQQEVIPLSSGEQIPLFIAIDQEGGCITRLPFGPKMPGNMALGAANSTKLTRNVAYAIGRELESLGINMNFAPVLDVETNQNNPVIGIRSFGADPHLVAEQGAAYIRGMHDAGILCSAKHFPGHGDVDVDSHLSLPLESHNRTRMEEVELVPFKTAIEEDVDAIMTAHIIFPAYDNGTITLLNGDSAPIPATLSHAILTGLLREELGFEGLIVTDAMMMKAISDNYGTGEASMLAVLAGADIILYPEPLNEAYKAVLTEYQTNPVMAQRVDESVLRILKAKEKAGLLSDNAGQHQIANDIAARIQNAEDICLGKETAEIEQSASEQTVTLVKNYDLIVPFPLTEKDRIVIFGPTDSFAQEMKEAVLGAYSDRGANPEIQAYNYQGRTILSDDEKEYITNASLLLVGTISSNATMRSPDYFIPEFVQNFLAYTQDKKIPVIGLALGQPYDIMYMPDIPVYFATYAGKPGGQNVHAAIRAIFGEISITGHLPVHIEDVSGNIIYPLGTGIVTGEKLNQMGT